MSCSSSLRNLSYANFHRSRIGTSLSSKLGGGCSSRFTKATRLVELVSILLDYSRMLTAVSMWLVFLANEGIGLTLSGLVGQWCRLSEWHFAWRCWCPTSASVFWTTFPFVFLNTACFSVMHLSVFQLGICDVMEARIRRRHRLGCKVTCACFKVPRYIMVSAIFSSASFSIVYSKPVIL